MKVTRILIVALQLVVMANAFGGGYYAMSGAPAWDPAWLDGSPFGSYLVPGLLLFAVVGGGMAIASLAWLLKSRVAPWLSLFMGATLVGWIVAQVAIIGYVSPLQPIFFVVGAGLAGLAGSLLRGQRPAARAEAA
jgi:hypothetical protein